MLKNPPANAEDSRGAALIPGEEDPLEEEMATHSNFLAMESPMDRGARWATVHGITKSWT